MNPMEQLQLEIDSAQAYYDEWGAGYGYLLGLLTAQAIIAGEVN